MSFDFIKTIEGRAYPEDEVTVYTDEDSIHKLSKLREKLQVTTNPRTKAYKELEAEAEKLADKIRASSATFKARGVAPAVVNLLVEKYQKNEDYAALQDELLSATLVSVTDAEGNVDQRKFDVEACEAIRAYLPSGAYARVSSMITDLNMNAAIYDETIDAGFLQKP